MAHLGEGVVSTFEGWRILTREHEELLGPKGPRLNTAGAVNGGDLFFIGEKWGIPPFRGVKESGRDAVFSRNGEC